MMSIQKRRLIPLLTTTLLLSALVLGACNLPAGGSGTTQPPPDVIYTAAAQTLQVQLTQNAQTQAAPTSTTGSEQTEPPPASPPAEVTPTSPPGETPVFTDTPTFTPTSAFPLISATVNTNCRSGPGTVYAPPVGVLAVGQTAEVHGRDSSQQWWYIQNPGKPGQFCWVWSGSTQVEGNTSSLPVITPPPPPATPTYTATPGPGFSLAFSKVHDCSGIPTAIFQVTNTGGGKLESLNLKIEDLTLHITLYGPGASDAPFMGSSGECPPGGDVLNPGKTLYIGGAIGAAISGHSARATVELCTENGLGGTCVQKTVDFTIP